jgi:hypothetical protein
MNIVDLDGNFHKWSLKGYIAKGTLSNKSSLHLAARELIRGKFPTFQILEEVPIPVRKSEILYLDFYLPLSKICIEVHGEQHYEFSAFFHGNRLNFFKHKKRDRDKKEWCNLNGIKVIELPYNKKSEWNEILANE